MDWKLELVVVPVTDVDRAERFYGEQLGFVVDHDSRIGHDLRVVQLTPPGRGARSPVERGVEVSPGPALRGPRPGRRPGRPLNSFVFSGDPDGNQWAIQERPAG